MSEPTQHTNIEGEVNGSVLPGNYNAPVHVGEERNGQTVTVNIQPIPPPPDTATHGERIRFLTAAMMQLQSYFVTDRNEREHRQQEQDVRYEEARQDRLRTRRLVVITLLLVFISLAIGITNSVQIMQLVERFGWLW